MYKDKKVNAIIQARMGSSRLPGKVLLELGDKKVLDYVIDRLDNSKLIDNIIVATSDKEQDDKIEEWAKAKEIDYYRGSEENVLKRFYDTANKYPSDIICRITADCPLISYKLVDEVIKKLVDEDLDYVSMDNDLIPRGLHGSAFTVDVLKDVYKKADKDYQKEHVTYYIYEDNGDEYKVGYLEPPEWLKKHYRLTLDTRDDYELLKIIFDIYINKKYINIKSVIKLLDNESKLQKINKSIKQKSVK